MTYGSPYLIPTRLSLLPALLAFTLLGATPAAAEPLGRLFYSPAERARIDHPPPPAPVRQPPPRLDGFILRSGGEPTLFLDGQATPGDTSQLRLQDASALVTTPDGRKHRVYVGRPPDASP